MSGLPPTVRRTIWLHWALVLLGLLTVALTVLFRDSVIEAWARGNRSAREVLERGGVEAVKAEVAVPAFVPLAVVVLLIMAALVWVLLAFLRNGYGWSRVALTGLIAFVALATVGGIFTGPPLAFVLLAVVSFALEVAALVYLWHPETGAYVARTDPHHDGD